MKLERYWFAEEPRGELYHSLIEIGRQSASRMILVLHPKLDLSDHAQAVLEQLQPWLESSEIGTEWPGTMLLGGETARVDEYALTAESSAVIAEAAEHLYAWVQPELPEDLSLLRDNGRPWLVTIAHEHESFLSLTAEEYIALGEQSPGLVRMLVPE